MGLDVLNLQVGLNWIGVSLVDLIWIGFTRHVSADKDLNPFPGPIGRFVVRVHVQSFAEGPCKPWTPGWILIK